MDIDDHHKIFAQHVHPAKTIVIKAGSSLLTQQGKGIDKAYLKKLGGFIDTLRRLRKKIILVSSGAVAAGLEQLPTKTHPTKKRTPLKDRASIKLATKQALASMGQVSLMENYKRIFSRFDIPVAQILLSKHSIHHRASYLNARHTLQALWKLSVLPIINENDSLATEELKLGDNDVLGALICGLADADLYIILSDTDGFYLHHQQEGATPLRVIDRLSEQHWKAAKGPGSQAGTGGMVTKLEAVAVNEKFSIPTLLTHGRAKNLYTAIFKDHKGSLFLGMPRAPIPPSKNTLITLNRDKNQDQDRNKTSADDILTPTSSSSPLSRSQSRSQSSQVSPSAPPLSQKTPPLTHTRPSSRKRWLFSQISPKGTLIIDPGARDALLRDKSLLAKGILSVTGTFQAGDVCSVCLSSNHSSNHNHSADSIHTDTEPAHTKSSSSRADIKNNKESRNEALIAKGLSNYSSAEIRKLCGVSSTMIPRILGYKGHDEIIHKNNLVLL